MCGIVDIFYFFGNFYGCTNLFTFSLQITSSSRKPTSRGGTKSNATTSIGPSKQRLARITAALSLEGNVPIDSNATPEVDAYLSQTLQEEDEFDDDFSRDAVNVSDEISVDEFEQGGSNDMKEEDDRLSEEETEIRKTAQALFALEESLMDQHISNIKENAEMLRLEDGLLQTIEQLDNPTDDDMDDYAIQLAEFLDRKEALILSLQDKLDEYNMYAISGH